ncbi:TPA: hypothetical protein JG832_002407 [Enterobacter hormaechei subsp. xiangfangensis]|nr:hypothetical protein [Enterobacter hormaechei subsp. xiangfangensis]HAV1890545.1 hypothetical protein [Enterobacter hormaechei subsp. xiangfangensis]
MFKRAIDILAMTAGDAGLKVNDVDNMKAMRTAAETFALMYNNPITPAQAWQLLALFNQARLTQLPTNQIYMKELLACHARAYEESQLADLAKGLATGGEPQRMLDRWWPDAPHDPLPDASQTEQAVLEAEQVNDPETPDTSPAPTPAPETEPAPPEPESQDTATSQLSASELFISETADSEPQTMAEALKEAETERQKEEDAAWEAHQASKPRVKADEIIIPGQMVKEWRDHDKHDSGWWRPGFPYKIVVYPQMGQRDAPEYFVHCAHKPTMETFIEHAEWYYRRLCFVRVKYSNGEDSTDLTREYTKKEANKPVGRTEMQMAVDDNWTEDAPWRIRFHDLRVNRPSYVYFDYKPGGMLLARYHRNKHYATVESREEWIANVKAANTEK